MKGVLDFLEKAGLVRKDGPVVPADAENSAARTAPVASGQTAAVASAAVPVAASRDTSVATALDLNGIYVAQGIGPGVYPAERLLRLVDGLRAMDETTRQMAIKAMDAADESWTIDDPLNDAAAKVRALAAYSESVQADLQLREQQTRAHLDAVAARREKVVGDIRKQISELEALVARELNRSAQEAATQEANLKAARDQINRDLTEVARVSQQLQGLASQFGPLTAPPKE